MKTGDAKYVMEALIGAKHMIELCVPDTSHTRGVLSRLEDATDIVLELTRNEAVEHQAEANRSFDEFGHGEQATDGCCTGKPELDETGFPRAADQALGNGDWYNVRVALTNTFGDDVGMMIFKRISPVPKAETAQDCIYQTGGIIDGLMAGVREAEAPIPQSEEAAKQHIWDVLQKSLGKDVAGAIMDRIYPPKDEVPAHIREALKPLFEPLGIDIGKVRFTRII